MSSLVVFYEKELKAEIVNLKKLTTKITHASLSVSLVGLPLACWIIFHAFVVICCLFSFFFKKFFQGHHHSVKWFGFRSAPTECKENVGPDLGPKCLQKVISTRQKSLLARKKS